MVSSVNNSLGSSAYVKGAQAGQQPSSRRAEAQEAAVKADTSAPVRESAKAEKAQSNDNGTPKRGDTMEARHDERTLQTEQARGSLLDMAV